MSFVAAKTTDWLACSQRKAEVRADAAGDIISLPVGSQVVDRKPGV